jgi:hypothetical protein
MDLYLTIHLLVMRTVLTGVRTWAAACQRTVTAFSILYHLCVCTPIPTELLQAKLLWTSQTHLRNQWWRDGGNGIILHLHLCKNLPLFNLRKMSQGYRSLFLRLNNMEVMKFLSVIMLLFLKILYFSVSESKLMMLLNIFLFKMLKERSVVFPDNLTNYLD